MVRRTRYSVCGESAIYLRTCGTVLPTEYLLNQSDQVTKCGALFPVVEIECSHLVYVTARGLEYTPAVMFDRIWLLVRLDRRPLYPGSLCMTAHARMADQIHNDSYTDISGDSISSTE
ncbi:hypothetical protein ABHI18_004609 [Aspergillus niger]